MISIVHMLLRIVGYSLGQIAWTDSASSYKYKVQRSIACMNLLLRAARDEILPRQTADR